MASLSLLALGVFIGFVVVFGLHKVENWNDPGKIFSAAISAAVNSRSNRLSNARFLRQGADAADDYGAHVTIEEAERWEALARASQDELAALHRD